MQTIVERGDFVRTLPDDAPTAVPAGVGPAPIETDPAIVSELIARGQVSVARLKRDIRTKTGAALLDFILADMQAMPARNAASDRRRLRRWDEAVSVATISVAGATWANWEDTMDRRMFLGAAGSVVGGCALEVEPGEDVGSMQQATTTWPDGTYATFFSSGRLYATHPYTEISYTHVVAAAAGTSWHANNPQRFSAIVTAMNEVRSGLCGNAARSRYNAINNWCSEFARWVLLAAGLKNVGTCVMAGRPNCQQMLYFSHLRTVQEMVGFFAMFNRYTPASQMTKTSVRPGDYLALTNSAGVKKGHSAIAMAVSADYQWVWTAEGNVGDCVDWNRRPFFVNGALHANIDGVGNIDLLL